jgi:hypothetical protein
VYFLMRTLPYLLGKVPWETLPTTWNKGFGYLLAPFTVRFPICVKQMPPFAGDVKFSRFIFHWVGKKDFRSRETAWSIKPPAYVPLAGQFNRGDWCSSFSGKSQPPRQHNSCFDSSPYPDHCCSWYLVPQACVLSFGQRRGKIPSFETQFPPELR